jgi:hypothetical protein
MELRGALVALFVAQACAAPPRAVDAPVATIVAAPAVAAPRHDPEVIHVAAATRPSKLAVDGDLGEWSASLADLKDGPDGSAVILALSNDGLAIAADLGAGAAQGIWVVVSARPSELRPVGNFNVGGVVVPFDCEHKQEMMNGEWRSTAELNTPDVAASCHRTVDAHAREVATHEKRFTKRWRIDSRDVRASNDEGKLEVVEGATLAWKSSATRATVEAALPLAAMPRMAEAPVTSIRVVALPASSPLPGTAPEEATLPLPEPISFEPYGKLRAALFDAGSQPSYRGGDTFYDNVGLSYQPGHPLDIEDAVTHQPRLLYEKKGALGDIEVGIADVFPGFVALFRRHEFIGFLDASTVEGVFVRDGQLHVASYKPAEYTMQTGPAAAAWSVVAVAPDGSHHEAVDGAMLRATTAKDGVGCSLAGPLSFGGFQQQFATPSFDRFGWRGSCAVGDGKKVVGFEVTWTWNAKTRTYVGATRRIPVPRAPRKPQ